MTWQPLSIDTDVVLSAGNQLLSSAGDLPLAPPDFTLPAGSDPLSVRITAEIPLIEGPISIELPAVKADATRTAGNVVEAANRYSETDASLGAQMNQQMQSPTAASPLGSGSMPAGGAAGQTGQQAGQMSQLMSLPMQMAQQAAQLPMQILGMAAQVPQGLMQGVQQGMQQMSQLGGSQSETGEMSVAEPDEVVSENAMSEKEPEEGAAPGEEKSERAPEDAPPPQEAAPAPPPPPRPAPTRPAEADTGIDL